MMNPSPQMDERRRNWPNERLKKLKRLKKLRKLKKLKKLKTLKSWSA